MLVLITFRPEFAPPWTGHAHVTAAHAQPARAAGRARPWSSGSRAARRCRAEVLEQIVAKTDGVPLFVEELTKAVLEVRPAARRRATATCSTGPLPPLAIPATLHDSPHGPPRPAGAGEGGGADRRRDRPGVLLRAARRGRPAARGRAADALWASSVASELVFCRGTPPDATYSFKHALVQDAAYGACSGASASSCTRASPPFSRSGSRETAETQPELLAHHYAEAGLAETGGRLLAEGGRATPWSGRPILRRSATWPAGWSCSRLLPDTPERVQRELELRTGARVGADGDQGLCGPGGGTGLRSGPRAVQPCRPDAQLFPVLHGLYRIYHVRGDLRRPARSGSNLPSWRRAWAIRPFWWRPTGPLGCPCSGSERWLSPAPNWKKGQRFTTRSCSIARLYLRH